MKLGGGQEAAGGLRPWNKQVSISHVLQHLLCFLIHPVAVVPPAQVQRCFHPGHPKSRGLQWAEQSKETWVLPGGHLIAPGQTKVTSIDPL